MADRFAPLPDRIPAREALVRRIRRAVTLLAILVAAALSLGVTAAAAASGPDTHQVATDPTVPTPTVPNPSTPSVTVAPNGTPSSPTPSTPSNATPANGGATPTTTASKDGADASVSVSFPNVQKDSSNSVVIILLLTVLSVAPSLLVLCTSFTRILIVLGLTRNAIGLQSVPPQQVVVGLSVFLTLFVMGPTFSQIKSQALDPLLDGKITTTQAYNVAQGPLREFLLKHTRDAELKLFLDASDTPTPVARDKVPLNALIPAFVLSELKSAFIMGFVIFVPFLVIDLVVSAVLISLGMMMLPPTFVSLPFKILLFIMLDGWMLVTGMLLTSYK